MQKPQRELAMMLGVKIVGVLVVGYFIWLGITSFLPKEEPWPPKDAEEEARIIAKHKQRLLIGDTPVSSLSPEQAATYTGRIIEHHVKNGDLKTARDYAHQAIERKLDAETEKHLTTSASRDLLAQVLAARLKREDFKRLVEKYEKRPPDNAAKETREPFDREFRESVADFVRTPFKAQDCPEVAEEIVSLYRARIEPHKTDPRLKDVVAEVERACLPAKPQ